MITHAKINDMIYAFRYYIRRGEVEALRLFPEYQQFFTDNQHKSAEEVEAELWIKAAQPVKSQRSRFRKRMSIPLFLLSKPQTWIKNWNLFKNLKSHSAVKAAPVDTVEG